MDVTDFCTNFNLAEHGIIDRVVQALVQAGLSETQHNGVRAELYKLNVGSFKAQGKHHHLAIGRSTPVHRESSSPKSTHPDPKIK